MKTAVLGGAVLAAIILSAAAAYYMIPQIFSRPPAAEAPGGAGAPAPGSGSAAINATIRIGILPVLAALPYIVADHEKVFERHGLSVELVVFSSARERDAAFQAGRVDMISIDPVTSLIMIDKGYGVRIVAMVTGIVLGDESFYILAPPNTSYGLGDVRSIAVSKNTVIEFAVFNTIKRLGLDPSAYDYKDVPSISVRYQLLMEGKVEAAGLPDPWASLALSKGARLLARSDQVGLLTPSVLLASRDVLSRPDGVEICRRVVASLVDALKRYREDPRGLADLIYSRLQIPSDLRGSWIPSARGDPAPYPRDHFQLVLEWLVMRGLASGKIAYDQAVVFREGERVY